MKTLWSIGIALVAFSVTAGVSAQQATPPVDKKPAVKQQAHPEKAGNEKGEVRTKLPAAVAAAFTKAYPGAVIKASSKERENGKTVYEVESVDQGVNRDLLYLADGTVIECEETLAVADLPAAVSNSLKALYPKATITKAEKTTKGDATQYDLTLKGAPVKEVAFSPEGKRIGDEKVK